MDDYGGMGGYDWLTPRLQAAEAECKRLQAENEALKAELQEQARIVGAGAERELSLMAKVEALKADAERYRWLRNTSQISASSTGRGIAFPHYETNQTHRLELDAAIDAAMKGQ